MKIWNRLFLCVAILSTVALPLNSAFGATVSGRSSTEIEWYDTGDGETAVPFYQYLLLNVHDIDGAGMSFRGYGRVADDLADEADVDSRLYYGYIEKKGLIDDLDVRLGRSLSPPPQGHRSWMVCISNMVVWMILTSPYLVVVMWRTTMATMPKT